jgi:hypothetical protein
MKWVCDNNVAAEEEGEVMGLRASAALGACDRGTRSVELLHFQISPNSHSEMNHAQCSVNDGLQRKLWKRARETRLGLRHSIEHGGRTATGTSWRPDRTAIGDIQLHEKVPTIDALEV